MYLTAQCYVFRDPGEFFPQNPTIICIIDRQQTVTDHLRRYSVTRALPNIRPTHILQLLVFSPINIIKTFSGCVDILVQLANYDYDILFLCSYRICSRLVPK